jgi:hypothetical protein
MKIVLMLLTIYATLSANYESEKIDMHGGSYDDVYQSRQNSFRDTSLGVSTFLDKNVSKKIKDKSEKK